jgi:nucleotide-binding universal stress UspA family protein
MAAGRIARGGTPTRVISWEETRTCRKRAGGAVTTVDFPVVVGVDGSRSGFEALDWAADQAARHGRALRVVMALGQPEPGPEPSARSVLADAERRAARRQPDVKISLDVLPQEPVPALLGEGREAFTLVFGCRGRGVLKRRPLGSVGLAVAGRAPCPVVVVRGQEWQREGRFGRIVLGVDGTEQGAGAVRFAFREAEVRGCELTAVHAWHGPPGGEDDAHGLVDETLGPVVAAHPAVRATREVVEAPVRLVLLREAETADLLVVGARRRTGVVGPRLGMVSHAVLHHAECPVAVIPQP